MQAFEPQKDEEALNEHVEAVPAGGDVDSAAEPADAEIHAVQPASTAAEEREHSTKVEAEAEATEPVQNATEDKIPESVAADENEINGEAATTAETVAVGESAPEKQEQKQEEELPDSPFRRGQLVEGVVTKTSPIEVTCSLAEGHEGIIPNRELERMNRQQFEELLTVGNQLQVYIINPRDHKGRILLSVNRALEEQDWQQAQEFQREQRVFQGYIAGYNKGGLIVRFGRLRGFVPMSQIAALRRREMGDQTDDETWRKQVNQPISVKVIEVNRKRSRLVLSERASLREQREKRKEELIAELKVGDVRTGPIVSLADFGVFVDLGGAEGLVHNSELSWRHIRHPRDAFRTGQEVRVEVISIDREKHRIGLSIKRQELDPWDEVAMNYSTGQLVHATITKIAKFGAFAQLEDSPFPEGLIHISELADRRIEHPREVVQAGEKVTLRITKIDLRNRRLGLSLKRVNSAEYLDMDWLLAAKTKPKVAPPEIDETQAVAPQDDASHELPTEKNDAAEIVAESEIAADEATADEATADEVNTDEVAAEDETAAAVKPDSVTHESP
ncbi:MAG: S1 RNA-binding domain-containing protein [Chloroflexi bacterium]|nr:S1 RNA-binding domain-containing protein [Chloroflexota bacterium]